MRDGESQISEEICKILRLFHLTLLEKYSRSNIRDSKRETNVEILEHKLSVCVLKPGDIKFII